MPKAASNYKQVRLTLSEEPRVISYRLWAKPINVEWNQGHTVLAEQIPRPAQGLETFEAVVLALIQILEDQVLPRSH